MPPLFESLSRLAERVEILARGLEGDRRAAETMLQRKRPLDAREHARTILAKVPGSPLGLALWADAAEAAWLDHEALEALTELARAVPWRADVWLRLGRVAVRTGSGSAREALERAAALTDDRASSRQALLDLCDLDLDAHDAARAARWLDRVPQSMGGRDEGLMLRRLECALGQGLLAQAAEIAAAMSDVLGEGDEEASADAGRRALALARAAWASADTADDPLRRAEALKQAVRAFVLECPGSRDVLSAMIAATRDAATLADLRALVAGADLHEDPAFVAAFAIAEGRRSDARAALVRAVAAGDRASEAALLRLALEARDESALAALVERRPEAVPRTVSSVLDASRALAGGDPVGALDALDAATGSEVETWADELRARAARAVFAEPRASWSAALDLMLRHARAMGTLDHIARIEAIAAERDKPIVVAVVGEFNAGKSTFINALIGVDVAPTGILPTTATLHRVAWAPDPFARIMLRGAPDRIVVHEALKETLAALQAAGPPVERVQIYAPIERLRWVEVLDTPGFNAPEPEHARAARAAFEEADVVVWLLDATGPMKASEGEILKETGALGLPIVVLLNKSDRLDVEGAGRVLEHTIRGLEEIGVTPHAPPLCFSAKLALRGRLGDPAALEASRWPEVEVMLSSVIVDRADDLRELAMRRRARRLVAELAAIGEARGAEERRRAEKEASRSAALRAASTRLAREAEEAAAWLEGVMDAERRALDADLRPLAQLGEGGRAEVGARTYTAERLVARLAGAVTLRLAENLDVAAPAAAAAMVASALEGVALSVASPDELLGAGLRRALVAAVRAASRAYALEAERAPSAAASSAAEKRLAAMSSALSGQVAEQGNAEPNAGG